MRREARKLQTAQDHFHGQRCLQCREDPPDDLERRHAHKSHDKAREQHAGEVQSEHQQDHQIDLMLEDGIALGQQ